MHLRCHACYLPRRAVEWKANCGGKIAPLQWRQVRCVCSISLLGWRKELASGELPGNNSVCEISDVFRFISHERAVSTCTCIGQALIPTTINRVVLGTLLCVVCIALFVLYPCLVLADSFSLSLPLIHAPLVSNMTIIRYEATGRRI